MSQPRDPEPDATRYVRVAVAVGNAHLDRPFDYALPADAPDDVGLGRRVRVSFAGRLRTGYVLEATRTPATDPEKIKPIKDLQGEVSWFDEDDLRLYRWVAKRYAASLADVLRHALPTRVVAVERQLADATDQDAADQDAADQDAADQDAADQATTSGPGSAGPLTTPGAVCPSHAWRPYDASALLNATMGRGHPVLQWLQLAADEDVTALVTDLVTRCLAADRGVLVLAPDPSSPLPAAALETAGAQGADLRSERGDRARYRSFLRLRHGTARLAAGERSAVFAPVPDLGLVIVADEANPAYKERRAPRHHARDVALARAQLSGASALLLGDVPSAHLHRLVRQRHVTQVNLDRATERDRSPRIEVVDRSDPRPSTRRGRFSSPAHRAVADAVASGGIAVVVVAMRGEGSALVCTHCGERRVCDQCAGSIRPSRYVTGGSRNVASGSNWECPACGWHGRAFTCRSCNGTQTAPLAAGVQRFAAELKAAHSGAQVVPMEGFDASGPDTRPAIAVMTRGSAVAQPNWLHGGAADVVVIPDADTLLHRPAVDAAEDTLRLWFTVARWTRRVVLQTHDPRHHAVQALVRWDANGFWDAELPWREDLGYPPAAHLIGVTAPPDTARSVSQELRATVGSAAEVLGPDPEGSMLVKTQDLHGTLAALRPLRAEWSKADAKVRVDVDPLIS